MSLFDYYKVKPIYIVSANSFDGVVDQGFYSTTKQRFFLSESEYNPNLEQEEIDKLKLAKRKLSELILHKEVVLKALPTNIPHKFLCEIYISAIGIPDSDKYVENTPAGDFVSVKKYLISNGYLKN